MSERTIRHASYMARRFLAFRFGEARDQPGEIAVKDISDFLANVLDRKSAFRDKTLSTHLRSFFGLSDWENADKLRQGGPAGCHPARHETASSLEAG
ncbi:hypothetical protein BTE77_33990 [Ensifer adhaerens]|nr:hypothetical protein BTE77_33990 [Ensifer adhaerens]